MDLLFFNLYAAMVFIFTSLCLIFSYHEWTQYQCWKKKPCNASSLLLVSFETFDIDFDEYLVLKKITNYMVTSIGELLLHLDLSIYVF